MQSAPNDAYHDYLRACRAVVRTEIERLIPSEGPYFEPLYRAVRDYPLRHGKGFRPALCLATCRALGGQLAHAQTTAAVLELYHNAFLIHDDIEDGSLLRRGTPTLHAAYGIPAAINVGDALLAITIEPLLDNLRTVGVGKALRVLRSVAQMARETAEGQALELHWIAHGDYRGGDADYELLVWKKTTWYTFLAPMQLGGLLAGAEPPVIEQLGACARQLGLAFQIQDDVLNLDPTATGYGKELDGDLWEGKHTLILLHALRVATDAARGRAVDILRRPRAEKTAEDVAFLKDLVHRGDSLNYARKRAREAAEQAGLELAGLESALKPGIHREFLVALARDVCERPA